ncbi:Uncharacterized protein PRO82_001772 [Candidatus Protochlamydia amoebophila]|uniref:Uncharacterized protein n=1 Tax=Candidatus Protochlamydia amoebophila TaxID=362787 RepID=A0A0C1H9B2_9BACT|nr:hypothetical protein [Candidatus Protochlamydia amoebophila]KIC73934.1 hypothetical protein DB44_AS00300 [Candidatus Protochlamydia amoebophila]MBS4164444.1 Uncharacterized protein [Candidatus Protochlamydia amoebophila]
MRVNKIFENTFIILELVEKTLNVAGYIPGIGTVSAYVRGGLASIEAVSGIGLTIIGFIANSQGNPASSIYLTTGITFIGHALLNGFRASFENQPFISLVTTLPYDIGSYLLLGRRVFPYLK